MKRMPERVYVRVNSDFDSTGFMQPRSITWKDGRTFRIEKVTDFRPAASFGVPIRENMKAAKAVFGY